MNKDLSLFPELKFPVDGSNEAYYADVENGYNCMKSSSAVICCCVRNIGEIFPYSRARIEKLASRFKNYKIIIYESDSTDDTKQFLSSWEKQDPNLDLEMEDLNNPNIRGEDLQRVQLMAKYRNKYLDKVYSQYSNFDYMVVVDPDLHGGWSLDGIANSFSIPNFSMIGSNGLQFVNNKPVFYDCFPVIMPNNERRKFFHFLDKKGDLIPELQRGKLPIPVRSCFGGIGIYKISHLTGRYEGWGGPNDPQSEHISLNINMQRRKFTKHFINPSMITIRHFSDTNFKGLGLERTLEFIYE